MTRAQALMAILALPDPDDLPRRAHYITAPADPHKSWEIKRDLGMAYVEHTRQSWTGGDISRVVRVASARLRMVR